MKDYWYLREGDFLPEPVSSICDSWHRSQEAMIEFLSQRGNIFTSRQEAQEASDAVLATLFAHQLHQGRRVRIRIDVGIPRCD